MVLFKNDKGKLERVKEHNFKLEKEIQTLTEKNLDKIFHLKFIVSELMVQNRRFDTLAFDEESRSFVIIEYKVKRNSSVVDQGMTYLNLIHSNKSNAILEYCKKTEGRIKDVEKIIDWTQTRVIFVSPYFTEFQKEAVNSALPFELWEVERFTDNLIRYEEVDLRNTELNMLEPNLKNNKKNEVLKEVKVYTEEDHLKKTSLELKEFYENLKERILDLNSNIKTEPKKHYIAFKLNKNIIDFKFYKSHLTLWLNAKLGQLQDPKKKLRNVRKIGHHGNGDYELRVEKNDNNIEFITYLMDLIKQSYEINK